jgi:transcriptional regulator with XRE-family HTH domain
MEISAVVRELWRRSGLTQDELITKFGMGSITREHFSAVINGREPGTPKMLDKVLNALGIPWEAVLTVPPDPLKIHEQELMIAAIRNALIAGDEMQWQLVENCYWLLTRRGAIRKPTRRRKSRAG